MWQANQEKNQQRRIIHPNKHEKDQLTPYPLTDGSNYKEEKSLGGTSIADNDSK